MGVSGVRRRGGEEGEWSEKGREGGRRVSGVRRGGRVVDRRGESKWSGK